MDGDVIDHHADHIAAQCSTFRNCNGLCLSEAASRYIQRLLKNIILLSAMLAAVATAMAEMLGGAIALQMLFRDTNKNREYADSCSFSFMCIYECL